MTQDLFCVCPDCCALLAWLPGPAAGEPDELGPVETVVVVGGYL